MKCRDRRSTWAAGEELDEAGPKASGVIHMLVHGGKVAHVWPADLPTVRGSLSVQIAFVF